MVFRRVAVAVVGLLALFVLAPTAESDFSDWSVPENLGPIVNSSFNDAGPSVSKNGLSLYFNSDRPDGHGGNDVWVSQWDRVERSWGPPINLGPVINTSTTESVPRLSRDEHWLFFNSNRSGGFGELDIWASYRWDTRNDFGWLPPVNLGSGINSAFFETTADYFENDDDPRHRRVQPFDRGDPAEVFKDHHNDRVHQVFFGSNRPGGIGGFDFYVSNLSPDGTFGPAKLVPELSSPMADPGLSIGSDGLEVFLFSNRPGTVGGQDLWTATRKTLFHPWSTPVNLGPVVNSAGIDSIPYIAPSGRALFFQSDRAGGFGGNDLYVTTRARNHNGRGGIATDGAAVAGGARDMSRGRMRLARWL